MEHLTLYHLALFAFFAGLVWASFTLLLLSAIDVGGSKRSPQDHEEHWQ